MADTIRSKFRVLLAVAVSVFMLSATVVFNMTGHDIGFSYKRVLFEYADVLQVEGPVLRGSRNQPVLHITVTMSGPGSGQNLQAISFTAGGTTVPPGKQATNARLWYTGMNDEFNTAYQCGSTIPNVPAGNFVFKTKETLGDGIHHFWLTFDIPAKAKPLSRVDAECNYIQLDMDKFLPFTSSPMGARMVEQNIPLYSIGGTGTGSTPAWNTRRDGSGITPDKVDGVRHTLFVQNGHKLECRQPVTVHSICIENGGMLRLASRVSAERLEVEDGGVLRHDGAEQGIESLVMHSGSRLMHNYSGALAGSKRQLAAGSEIFFYRLEPKALGAGISWGSVIVFDAGLEGVDVAGLFEKVKGNLEVRKTGTRGYLYCSGDSKIKVGGSLLITGGSFMGNSGGRLELEVGGSLVIRDGLMADAVTQGAGQTIMKINGHVILDGGLFHFDRSGPGGSALQLTPAGHKGSVVSWRHKACDSRIGDMTIAAGLELIIESGKLGDLMKGYTLTVMPGATLTCNQFPVTGPGRFELEKDATLGIGSIMGINSAVNEGNILTGERSFSSGASYIFVAGTSPQQSGRFDTAPAPGTVQSVTIDKENPDDVVVLSSGIKVVKTPVVRMGRLLYDPATVESTERGHNLSPN